MTKDIEDARVREVFKFGQPGAVKPAPWIIRIPLAGFLLFGLYSMLSVPYNAVMSVKEWIDPDIYISAETRSVLSEREIEIMEKMPEKLRRSVEYRDVDKKANYVNDWQDARMQTCRHGSTTITSGDRAGFKQCTSQGQAELQKWAFDRIMDQ